MNASEVQFLLRRLSVCLLIFAVGGYLFPQSSIPIVFFIIGMSSALYKTSSFNWLIKKFININNMPSQREDLINAVATLQRYKSNTLVWNTKKLQNFKKLSYNDQNQAKSIGYYDHIKNMENHIKEQGLLAEKISQNAIEKNQITSIELRSALYQNNSKAIESLTHFARDWTELGEPELKPLLSYITDNIKKNLPTENQRSRTLVIVPGSGLGRVAHEISKLEPSFKSVQSVEFSAMMYICNDFVYSDSTEDESYPVFPFLHTYSHHTTASNQSRSAQFTRQKQKPSNLTINYDDLRTFSPNVNLDDYDNVLIVSAFFIDTAQNLFDYFKGFERLIGDKKGLWINIGPLKYGTAPYVEFTLEEIRELRKLRGWKDLDEPQPFGSEISGYLTDTKGLWQGYYGLGRWTSSLN